LAQSDRRPLGRWDPGHGFATDWTHLVVAFCSASSRPGFAKAVSTLLAAGVHGMKFERVSVAFALEPTSSLDLAELLLQV
jgi:hypothetical protein